MKESSKKPIDYYIWPNKMMCSVFGVPLTDRKYSIYGKIFAYFRLTLSFVSTFSFFVPQIMLIAVKWGDLKILTNVGCIVITIAQQIFKLVYLVAKRERINRLYMKMKSIWDLTDDLEERQSFEKFAHLARRCSIGMYTFGVCPVVIFLTAAAVNYFTVEYTGDDDDKTRYLPFDVWYGTDVTASPKYEIAFVCQSVGMLILNAGITAIDTSCLTTILHVSGQFKLLNVWLTKIGRELNCECDNCLQNVKADLAKCIHHHQRMINVVKEVNNILTPIVFMQVFTSGIEICLSEFALLINYSSEELVKAIVYLSVMTAQLLEWCCPGEILIQNSREVAETAYLNVPWYKLPPNYRKQLLLIILRSQKHCSIVAITFQSVSLQTLTSVFNTAASYFAVLRQMQEKRMPE